MTAGRRAGRVGEQPALINRYLAELDRHLAVPPSYRQRVLAEALDHLSEAIAATAAGGDAGAGAAEAVQRFGPADRLAAQINAGWASARARRAPALAFLAGAGVLSAAVAAIPTIPPSAGPDGGLPVAVLATVALLALQLAVVAGAVSLLRVLARGSVPLLDPADRALAWRAARLCVAATAIAGAGFLGVAAVQSRRTGSGAGRVVLGAFVMVAVLVPIISLLRRPLSAGDSGAGLPEAESAEFAESGMAGFSGPVERFARLTERAVAFVRGRPRTATVLLAGLCAAGSYGHAETGRPGSVVAALVEATAVVVSARVFGPTLELRPGRSSAGAGSGGSAVSG